MKGIIFLFAIFNVMFASAQNWQEWTSQKKTQIKYLRQQIAANKIYFQTIGKGYSIASKGLYAIKEIKDGDIKLHRHFQRSLKMVNPKIRYTMAIVAITELYMKIKQASKQIYKAEQLTAEEIKYCSGVFKVLLQDCSRDMDELFTLVTDGAVTMTDGERIKRISLLYDAMQSKQVFCISFNDEMKILVLQRLAEQAELTISKKINGLQ